MTQDKINKMLDIIGSCVSKLTRHKYFTKKLYLRVWPKNKPLDEAELHIAFINRCLYDCGIDVGPTGSIWMQIYNTREDYKERYDLNCFDVIWKDYIKWQWDQR